MRGGAVSRQQSDAMGTRSGEYMTQHIGRNDLIDRLTAQIGGNREMAVQILRDRGHIEPHTENFTAEGAVRNSMTAEERAKDRQSRISGKPTTAFKYNPRTNRATLK